MAIDMESENPGGGGTQIIFWWGVGPRSETSTHIQGFFSLKVRLILLFFFEIFANQDPFPRGFLPQKMSDFTIFSQFLWNGILF